jgi:AraC-like DNA-binding protein
VIEGRFEWIIKGQQKKLYPGDTVVVLPGQEIGGVDGYLGIGTFMYLQLRYAPAANDGSETLGKWSGLSPKESAAISKVLGRNNRPVLQVKEVAGLLQEMRMEIMGQELGYLTRVNYMLDSLLIVISRQCARLTNSEREFPPKFTRLAEILSNDLSHHWTVEEMASVVGLGKTAFAEKIKRYTGFSPLLYLINLRILNAIELLKYSKANMTDIALKTGFYSSQHFATTFKKFTGHTPGEFRKRNLLLP